MSKIIDCIEITYEDIGDEENDKPFVLSEDLKVLGIELTKKFLNDYGNIFQKDYVVEELRKFFGLTVEDIVGENNNE